MAHCSGGLERVLAARLFVVLQSSAWPGKVHDTEEKKLTDVFTIAVPPSPLVRVDNTITCSDVLHACGEQ